MSPAEVEARLRLGDASLYWKGIWRTSLYPVLWVVHYFEQGVAYCGEEGTGPASMEWVFKDATWEVCARCAERVSSHDPF